MATAFADRFITIPNGEDFLDEAGLIVEFIDALDLRELGSDLIERYAELHSLKKCSIAYSWRREGGKRNGDVVLGNLSLAKGMVRYLTEYDFLLWIAADHAREYQLSEAQLEAALFHQLCHGMVKKGKPAIRRHDIEGFSHELRRYGAWTSELKSAKDIFEQATLPFTGPVPYGTVS